MLIASIDKVAIAFYQKYIPMEAMTFHSDTKNVYSEMYLTNNV